MKVGVGKTSWTAFMRKQFFFGSMCLRLLHVTALSFALFHLVHTSCFLCPTAVAKCLTSSRWWISSDTIFLLFDMDSLDHQCCGCRPSPAFPLATVRIISFILKAYLLVIYLYWNGMYIYWKGIYIYHSNIYTVASKTKGQHFKT